MNNNSILIAIVCGLIAAVLFLSPLTLGGLGMGLSSFTAFPLFVAVLGFGTVAGIISSLVTAVIVAFFFGLMGGISVLGATLAPALWIGYSAGLSRNEDGSEEWFPLSQILFRLAAISAAIVVILGMLTGYSQEWAIAQTSEIMKQISQMQADAGGTPMMDAEQTLQRATSLAGLVPIMMPVSILFLMVINLRLAERFVRRRNWILRPRDDIPAQTALPVPTTAILLAAVAGGFMSNDLGLIAKVIAGAFGGAFVLVGLATIHFITRGVAARPFILPATYIVLFLSTFMAPIFAVLGVAETLFQLRQRFAAGPNKT